MQTGDLQLLVIAEEWLMLNPTFPHFPCSSSTLITETYYSYRKNPSTEVSTVFVKYCRADQQLYALLYDFVFKTKNLLKVTVHFYYR